MSHRPIWYADTTEGGRVVTVDDGGDLIEHANPVAMLEIANAQRAIVWTEGCELQTHVAELAIDRGWDLDVALGRGDGLSMKLRAVWLDKCAIVDRSMLLPDAGLRAELAEAQLGAMPGRGSVFEAEARIGLLQYAHASWRERIVRVAELQPRLSVGATAAGVFPRTWRRAAQLLQREEPWQAIRHAYYGGRIECYRPGFEGDAIEYDLRGAYGWSLSKPIPDWKIYERKWIPVQDPAWLDCTVEVSGHPGPLPVRDEAGALSWPTSGWHRGIWTRIDLEQSGVQIKEVHRQLAGRWSGDLQPAVNRWLQLREDTDSGADRSLLRILCCSLAGKLCQKPVSWKLWRSSAEPPVGAQPLALGRAVFAVPTSPLRWPLTCPQAGSFVTARVRSKVRPALSHPEVVYTDTDSAHYPSEVTPPAELADDIGPAAGQWSVKATGRARYSGVRSYRIGEKTVGAIRL